MKKRLCIIISIVMIVIALLLATIAAVGLLFFNGNELEVGRIVVCDGNTAVFVDENGGFWAINDASVSKNLFKGLKTGDKILIYRSSAMLMSYPGQCAVKWCYKLEEGSESNIPESVLIELKKIGWVK